MIQTSTRADRRRSDRAAQKAAKLKRKPSPSPIFASRQ
jgi:hypothetical protein